MSTHSNRRTSAGASQSGAVRAMTVFAVALSAATGWALIGTASASATEADVPVAAVSMTTDAKPCKPGFVWRDSYDGDAVCVTPQERDEAWAAAGR